MSSLTRKLQQFFRLFRSDDPRDRIRLDRRLKTLPLIGAVVSRAQRLRASLTQRTPEDYLAMQRASFERYAAADHVVPGSIDGDFVVGSWQQHDAWSDYEEYLMRYVPTDASWVALEFGCGPGRNIRRWSERFARVDGVDISTRNLENARVFLSGKIPLEKMPQLFVTRGDDCGPALRQHYDFAFSTICLQHICVHSVRFRILQSLFECLQPGGRLSVQMGFGVPSPNTVGYEEDFVQATATNRDCDVAVSSPAEIERDLIRIGFENFEHWIRPTGPGDVHPHWIFFTAIKPAR
jgi:SAM-dependent methyltransferase